MSGEARESPAVRAGLIASLMAGFVAFVVIAIGALLGFYHLVVGDLTLAPRSLFPEPRLQTRFDGLRDPEIAEQLAQVKQFRWIDRDHGVFQIPIARAMQIVAARGAAAYEPVPKPSEDKQP